MAHSTPEPARRPRRVATGQNDPDWCNNLVSAGAGPARIGPNSKERVDAWSPHVDGTRPPRCRVDRRAAERAGGVPSRRRRRCRSPKTSSRSSSETAGRATATPCSWASWISAPATARCAAARADPTSSRATPRRAGCIAASPGSSSRRCRRKATPLTRRQKWPRSSGGSTRARTGMRRARLPARSRQPPPHSPRWRTESSPRRSETTGRSSCRCRRRFRRSTTRDSPIRSIGFSRARVARTR